MIDLDTIKLSKIKLEQDTWHMVLQLLIQIQLCYRLGLCEKFRVRPNFLQKKQLPARKLRPYSGHFPIQ